MYKKVYVEITNNCNLSCDFCIKNKRINKFMNEKEFNYILTSLKGYTNYLYLHVLGEPLMHPQINEFINTASKDYFINITTNGYLINRIKDNKNIRQINISLHSFDEKYNISLNEYLSNILEAINILKEYTYISLRLWTKNKYKNEIISTLESKYNKKITSKMKLDNNIFIEFENSFTWPSLDNKYISNIGTCYALKDHIAILVDGTVVPCCLDSYGDINLGNIFNNSLEEIINTSRYQNILKGFKSNNKCEELCQKCNFIK